MKKIKTAQATIEQADEMSNLIEQLQLTGIQVPEDFAQYTPDQILTWSDAISNETIVGDEVLEQIREFAEIQQNLAFDLQEQGIDMTNIESKNKTFNFKKAQFDNFQDPEDFTDDIDPMLTNMEEDSMADPMLDEPIGEDPMLDETLSTEEGQWQTHHDLKEWLDQQSDRTTASDFILARVSDPYKQSIVDVLETYYEEQITEEDKLQIASQIFEVLPDVVKVTEPDPTEGIIEAPYRQAATLVNEINDNIKKIAQKNNKNPFNMSKFAQHKSIDTNVIMYGPEETKIDAFLNQPISDYHIVERNKGFGLVVDDIWNIDWEALWRGNIMDKYSRPYRDKDGNWTGGYIQKRFEVDKWVPEQNNYQLKPGQLRKPYLPEIRSTESRLEAMREKQDRGYEPTSSGKPYNWTKEASSKKKS